MPGDTHRAIRYEPPRPLTNTIPLKASVAAANTMTIGISAQRISVALRDADVHGQSRSGVRNVMMEAIIVANTARAIAAHTPTMISMPFTGRMPPSG
jgi:hypothetical protein